MTSSPCQPDSHGTLYGDARSVSCRPDNGVSPCDVMWRSANGNVQSDCRFDGDVSPVCVT